jgi:hypothetical protein
MTPIKKANELFVKYRTLASDINIEQRERTANVCAIICVDEIIDAFISGGRYSFELQNMDKEFRFWYEVKDELNRMKS